MGHLTLAVIGAFAWLAGQAVSRLGSAHPWLEGVVLMVVGLALVGAGLATRRRPEGEMATGESLAGSADEPGAAAGLAATATTAAPAG
jgi:hypothetical protein